MDVVFKFWKNIRVLNNIFYDFLKQKKCGIKNQLIAWYSIHQNKIVYRTTKTIVDMERYMLHLKQLPKNLEGSNFFYSLFIE